MHARVTYRFPHESEVQVVQGRLLEGLIPNSFVLSEFTGKKQWSIVDEKNASGDIQLPMLPDQNDIGRAEYRAKLNELISRIESDDDLEKVVFSRRIQLTTPQTSFKLLFEKLAAIRPTAFVYLLESELHGVWLGASPEVLVHGNGSSFKTYSLAGTLPLKGASWSQKEIREQEIVTSYMSEILRAFDASVGISEVKERQAGNVKHLLTELEFNIRPDQLEEVLRKLHPTPAVGGLSKTKALKLIDQLEEYDRGLYAGFLGIYKPEGNTALYVNLRGAQMDSTKTIIYVGGGITADSNPNSEWEETELKSQSIRELLS